MLPASCLFLVIFAGRTSVGGTILGRRYALETKGERRSFHVGGSSRQRQRPPSRHPKAPNERPPSKHPKAPKERPKFDCNRASYRTATIWDFVYEHHCFPNYNSWRDFLRSQRVEAEMRRLSDYFSNQQNTQIVPPLPLLFRAFTVGGVEDIKVIILGQDPTPQPNRATGLAFSLWPDEDPATVPSVFNMLVELRWEGMNVGLTNGDLTPWVAEGVMLLNAALTTVEGRRGAHQRDWEHFTDLLIRYISAEARPSAWILWGRHAEAYATLIDRRRHYVKIGGHPSPPAAVNFFGGNYFHCTNEFFRSQGRSTIRWTLSRREGARRPQEDCNLG